MKKIVGTGNDALRVTAAIPSSRCAAADENAVAIVAYPRSGMMARAISRFRPPMPIVVTTPSEGGARQLRSSWGVQEIYLAPATDIDIVAADTIDFRRIHQSADYFAEAECHLLPMPSL